MVCCVPKTCHSNETRYPFHCLENPKQSSAVECVCAYTPEMKVKEFLRLQEVSSCGPIEAPGTQCVCLHDLLSLGTQKQGK
jgi:hypothetical protein